MRTITTDRGASNVSKGQGHINQRVQAGGRHSINQSVRAGRRDAMIRYANGK
jgi:hypothetical protein